MEGFLDVDEDVQMAENANGSEPSCVWSVIL